MAELDHAIVRALCHGGALSIVTLDASLAIQSFNARAMGLLGMRGQDLGCRSFLEWVHPADRERIAAELGSVRADALDAFDEQCRFLQDDGRTLWMRMLASRARTADGEATTVVVLLDITSRMQAQLAAATRATELATLNSALAKLTHLGSRLLHTHDLDAVLHEILVAAIDIAGADQGAIELYDPSRQALRIVAHHGFDTESLAAFARARAQDGSARGLALAGRARAVVEDAGAHARQASSRDASSVPDLLAFDSIPLLRWDGSPLGLLSTHDRASRATDPEKATSLDLYARLASALIEHWNEIDALRSRQRSLDLALEGSGAGIWSYDVASGMLALGPRASRMVGLPERENRVAVERIAIDPAHCEQARARLRQMHRSPGDDRWDLVLARSTQDSGEVDGVRWLQTHGRVERGPHGELLALQGIVIDVSEGRRTESALLTSAAQLRSIIDTAVDSIVVIDESGIIQAANLAVTKSFGYAADELLGRNVKVLMPAAESAAHDAWLGNYVRTGIRKVIGIGREVQGLRKNGSTFPVDLAVAEWRDASGRRFFTGILRDITQRKQHEQAIAAAQRMEVLGQLASGISHDFNNLLAVIAGNLELAESRMTDDAARELVRRALDAVQIGSSFNRRLLSLSRRHPPGTQAIDLNARVAEMAKLLARALGERIALELDLSPDLWITRAEAGEIDSSLLNLAINARDAMPAGGKLAISTRNGRLRAEDLVDLPPGARDGEYVVLKVDDDGHGMSAETLERASEPFFSTKEPGRGTGLGLSTIASYLSHLGGLMTLGSEPGNGCTVTLYFPRAIESSIEERNEDAGGLPRGSGESILVVEDDDDVRDVVVRQLRTLGYEVEEARSGVEALARMSSGNLHAQLVLSDVVMPGAFSGYDLARWLAANRPRAAVVLSSGYNESDRGELDIGPSGISMLSKPYTMEQLARTMHAALRRRAPSAD